MRTQLYALALAGAMAGGLACSDDNSGIGLAITTRGSSTTVQNGDSTVVVRGNDTLIIRDIEMVMREIELERVEDLQDCPDSNSTPAPMISTATRHDDDEDDDDACEEFSTGALLVDLPLGDETDRIITVDVPAGMYDEVEFEIHKPDEVRDAAFIAANPDFARISIRVTGTFSKGGTRSDFTYTTDLNEEQEIELDEPLDVTADGPVNLTIRLDIVTWFLNASGTALVDPATANEGGPNEKLVEDNIEESIDAFHDDDGDGLDDDDHDEDDDGGSDHDDDDDDDDNSGPGGGGKSGPGE